MNIAYRHLNGPLDWGWINHQIPILQVEDTSGLVAYNTETHAIVGACVFDNWTDNSVQTHFTVANPMVLKHGFLQTCYDFIFNVCDKRYMYGMVPADNAKALKLNKHMGWTEKMRLPEAFADGVDYVVMELKRENCKYLPLEEAA